MKNSIYISQHVPDELVAKYELSQAANNFCKNIVDLDYFSICLSIPPSNVDNKFKPFIDANSHVEYHVCRVFPHKGLFRIVNCILDNLWIYYRLLCLKEHKVWWYNIYSGNLIAYLLSRFLSKNKNFVLLADYNPNRYNNILGKFILSSLKSANGIISLSARCSNVNKNFMSIPGIIPSIKIQKKKGVLHSNAFLLSGTLNENTGLGLAIEVFKQLPTVQLYMTGILSIDKKQEIEGIEKQCPNIHYLGFMENYQDYLNLLSSVDYVLSLRNPKSPVNTYNFPSKILETLAYNKIVISTIKYPELKGINYIISKYDVNELVTLIKDILSSKMDDKINSCLDNSSILSQIVTEQAWIKAFEKIENK